MARVVRLFWVVLTSTGHLCGATTGRPTVTELHHSARWTSSVFRTATSTKAIMERRALARSPCARVQSGGLGIAASFLQGRSQTYRASQGFNGMLTIHSVKRSS